jgi:predicted MarR family transcription regulator
MTHRFGFMTILFLCLLTTPTVGRASGWEVRLPADGASTTTPPVEQEDASKVDLVFRYRVHAAELRDLARLLDLEAEIYSQRQDPERAKHKLELARDIRIAADAADDKADYHRQRVPHNQVD